MEQALASSSGTARTLTALQSWRVMGFAFVVAGVYGILPKAFAYTAGWGDFAIGLTAPIAAFYLSGPGRRRSFIAWQILGIFDLALAGVLGVLSSARVPVLGGSLHIEALTRWPLNIIPFFWVPIVLTFHILSIRPSTRARAVSAGSTTSQSALTAS